MFIEFQCPCGFSFRTQAGNAGKPITCPDCSASLTVPQRAPVSQDDKPSAKAPQKALKSGKSKRDKKRSEKESKKDLPDSLFALGVSSPSKKNGKRRLPNLPSVAVKPNKKSKREKKESSKADKGSGKGLIVGLVFAFIALFAGMGIILGPIVIRGLASSSGKDIEYETVRHEIAGVRLDFPKGWTVSSGGGQGNAPAFLRAESQGMSISMRVSLSGSAVGDMARANDDQAEGGDPVEEVHDFQKSKIASNYNAYDEAGQATSFESTLGLGKRSDFTAKTGFGFTVRGVRATILSRPDTWQITCECSSSQWKTYQDVFHKVVESAKRL